MEEIRALDKFLNTHFAARLRVRVSQAGVVAEAFDVVTRRVWATTTGTSTNEAVGALWSVVGAW